MKTERRKYPRYPLKNNEVFILDHHSEMIAELKDISFGGMQLRYLPGAFADDQCALFDLVIGENNSVLISCLSCDKIYDFADLMENGSFSGKAVRCCGLRFNGLTDAQKDRLRQIVEGRRTEWVSPDIV